MHTTKEVKSITLLQRKICFNKISITSIFPYSFSTLVNLVTQSTLVFSPPIYSTLPSFFSLHPLFPQPIHQTYSILLSLLLFLVFSSSRETRLISLPLLLYFQQVISVQLNSIEFDSTNSKNLWFNIMNSAYHFYSYGSVILVYNYILNTLFEFTIFQLFTSRFISTLQGIQSPLKTH